LQCHHINQDKYDELSKTIPKDRALSQSRCEENAVEGYTRCSQHGGSSLVQFFSRDLKPDQQIQFKELFENMLDKYSIDTENLFLMNVLAATCRELTLSHNANVLDLRGSINQALSYAKELALTPKEQKQGNLHIYKGEKAEVEAGNIADIVAERKKLEDKEK